MYSGNCDLNLTAVKLAMVKKMIMTNMRKRCVTGESKSHSLLSSDDNLLATSNRSQTS